jgi:hypothetical protein
MVPVVHASLARAGQLTAEHLVDAGCADTSADAAKALEPLAGPAPKCSWPSV